MILRCFPVLWMARKSNRKGTFTYKHDQVQELQCLPRLFIDTVWRIRLNSNVIWIRYWISTWNLDVMEGRVPVCENIQEIVILSTMIGGSFLCSWVDGLWIFILCQENRNLLFCRKENRKLDFWGNVNIYLHTRLVDQASSFALCFPLAGPLVPRVAQIPA